jgi:putative nucleotidyltransferase with HDIG domain
MSSSGSFVRESRATHAPTSALPASSLAGRVEAAIRDGKVDLPVLPAAATRVRAIVERNGGVAEIVGVIEREPSLAAAMLRYANSVAYAGLREITDLPQAVMRLGFVNVEKTVMAISAKGAFSSQDRIDEHLYRALWRHSLATALAARRIAPRSLDAGPETVFLAGLLHDIGKLVVLRCASQLRRSDPVHFGFSDETLLEFIQALHCSAGEQLCAAWNLPAEIRAVVRRHHEADLNGSGDLLIAVVQLANLMTRKAGASLTPDPDVSLVSTAGAITLRLDDVKLTEHLIDLEDDIAKMDSLF